ncbi:bile acid-sensitive ion channel-like [Babylonia areolata]|uniref:bile acid-sensitive ion channel-like n=1 Tax=Babylonia areolata TaxID=304850 RepID=UPI003FD49AB7
MYDQNSRDMLHMTDYTGKRRVLRSQSSGPASPTNQDGEKPAVRDLLVYYARHSTMHGIPSIVGSRLYRGRRIFWCCVVCVMAMLLVTVIYWQMSDFYRYPTVTSVNVQYVDEDDFPAVTICDLNMFNKLFIEQLDEATQQHMTYLTEISGIFHTVGQRLLDKLLLNDSLPHSSDPDADRIIVQSLFNATIAMIEKEGGGLQCSWGDFYWENCSVGLQTRVTDMGMCFTVDTRKLVKNLDKAKRRTSNGNNASHTHGGGGGAGGSGAGGGGGGGSGGGGTTYNPHWGNGNPVRNAIRGLSLVVSSSTEDVPYRLFHSEGFKVVLHDHREDPLPMTRGFVIGTNCTVEVEINKQVRIGLAKPFLAFGTGTCVDVEKPGFVNPLKRYPFYTKEACETECFIDSVIKMCRCRHFLHPGNETMCSLQTLRTCFRQAEANHYGGGTGRGGCACPMPCKQNIYSSGVSFANFRTTAMFNDILKGSMPYGVTSLHLYFPDPIVTTIEQVPVYSLEGLLGSIGGQVGLFMGFSLVTVAEMCELIFLLCTRSRRLFSEETRHVLAHPHPAQMRVQSVFEVVCMVCE